MRSLKTFFVTALASILFSTQVLASSLALMTGPLDPAAMLSTFNQLILNINAQVGAAGNGAVGAGINVANTANAVNALLVTPGATGSPLALSVGGSLGKVADTNASIQIIPLGTGLVQLGNASVATCSGTTTATCQGQQFVVTITGLVTAASTLSAAMVVTDATVVASTNNVVCTVEGYTGTGVPLPAIVAPGTGSVSIKIQNVSTGAALNANVPVHCIVES